MRNLKEFNNTAVVVAHSATVPVPRRLRSVTLTSLTDAAFIVIRTGGASGTVVLSMGALMGPTVQWQGDAYIPNGIHLTKVAGEAIYVSIEWE